MTKEEVQAERNQHIQKPRDEGVHWTFGEMKVIRGHCSRLQRMEGKEVKIMNIFKYRGDRHVEERLGLFCAAS